MQRALSVTRAGLVLGVAMAAAGCSAWDAGTTALDRGTSGVYQGIAWTGDKLGAPWGGMQPSAPAEGRTVQRIQGQAVAVAPLLPEQGNVWPEAERPRATLINPEAALRNIPDYRVNEPRPNPGPADRVRGSGGAFAPNLPPGEVPQERVLPSVATPSPAPGLQPGQVIPTPQGNAVVSGAAGRSGTVLLPGGRTGTVYQDGPTTLITPPGGQPQAVPTPR